MQTQGSLDETNLASLLQTMQSERATGTLALDSGDQSASLYFLFGHLFHATSDSDQGEGVVLKALDWHTGGFTFDPRAKLPAEETIKSSPADLIAQAGHPAAVPAAAYGTSDDTSTAADGGATTWTPVPIGAEPQAADTGTADPTYTSTWNPPAAEPAAWEAPTSTPLESPTTSPSSWDAAVPVTPAAPDTAPEQPAAWAAAPEPVAEPQADPAPAAWEPATSLEPEPTTWTPEPTTWNPSAPTTEPAPTETTTPEPAPDTWQPTPIETYSPAAYTPPVVTPSVVTPEVVTPEPVAVSAPATATAASAPLPMYPLPSGKAMYEGLKSAFVDFPKLLRTLRTDNHTGYVRLTEDNYMGTLLFSKGELLETLSNHDVAVQGEAGFVEFRRHMEDGNGLLDVVELNGDTVSALAQLMTGPPLFTGLLGRFVDFDSLLEYLKEEAVTGSVVVADASTMGVILLTDGKLLIAYTGTARQPSTKPDAVAALAKEAPARIEVKSTAGDPTPIDIEAALAKSY